MTQPNTICRWCLENIIPNEDTCTTPTGKHIQWRGDNTGLLQEYIKDLREKYPEEPDF